MCKIIKSWFTPQCQTDLEAFIASKNPANAAELEHWIKAYSYGKSAEQFGNLL